MRGFPAALTSASTLCQAVVSSLKLQQPLWWQLRQPCCAATLASWHSMQTVAQPAESLASSESASTADTADTALHAQHDATQQLGSNAYAQTAMKVRGAPQYAIKTDIMDFFLAQGILVYPQHVRAQYNDQFKVYAWWVKFGSEGEREYALTFNNSMMSGSVMSFYRQTEGDFEHATKHPLMPASTGCYVLLENVPMDATIVDVLLHFRDYNLEANPIVFVDEELRNVRLPSNTRTNQTVYYSRAYRQGKRVLVHFASQEEAYRAQRTKQNLQLLVVNGRRADVDSKKPGIQIHVLDA